jgi:Flp pilus assembly protein TadG
MPMLTMPTATPDERVAYLMDRAMDLAADWVRRGLTTGEIDRFHRVTDALARALGEDVTVLRESVVEDARDAVAADTRGDRCDG